MIISYKYFKFFAAIGGWVFGGFFGAIGAYFLTIELIDKKYNKPFVYELCLLKLCSLLIRADGRVEESEVQAVRSFFKKIFGEQKASRLFKEIKNRSDIPDDPEEIVRVMKNVLEPKKYYIILEFLFSLAAVDGNIAVEEEELVFRIGYAFGFDKNRLLELKRLFYRKNESNASSGEKLSRAFEILGLEPSATAEEIKKAYRRLSMEYHPDRLSGISESLKKLAEAKFIEIKEAYDVALKSKK